MEDVAFELGIALLNGIDIWVMGWQDILNNGSSLNEGLEVEQHLAFIGECDQ